MPLACPAEFPVSGYKGAPAQDCPLSSPAASPPGWRAGSVLHKPPRLAETATIRRASRRHSKNECLVQQAPTNHETRVKTFAEAAASRKDRW